MAGEGGKGPLAWSERIWIPLLGAKASFDVLDRDGIIVYESDAVFDLLGYRPEEVVGQRGRMLLQPDELEAAWKLANAAWEGTNDVADLRFRHKDGSLRWIELHASRLDDEHLLLYRRDITARRLAEEELQRTNLLLAAVTAIQAEYIASPNVVPFQRLLDTFVTATGSGAGVFGLVGRERGGPTVKLVAQSDRPEAALARIDELQHLVTNEQPIEHRGSETFIALRGSDASLLGVVILAGREGGYDDDVVERCRPLTLTATRVLESDRDRLRHADAEQQVELLKTLALAIAEARDLDTALAVMVRTLVERTGWEFGQAWVTTLDKLGLEATSAWFASDPRYDVFREASKKIRYGPGEGMVGRVWMTKEPWWVDDTEAASRGFPRVDVAREVGLVVSFCFPIVADGEVVALLEFFSSRHRPEDQRMLGVVAACAAQVGSILERKRVERGFQVLSTALRDMRDAATVTSQRGDALVFEYANPAYKRLMGFDPADIVGRAPTLHYGPATDLAVIDGVIEQSAAGRAVRYQLFLYDAEGRARRIELSNTPVPNESGEAVTHVTFWREVGDTRESEAAPESAAKVEITWRQAFDGLDLPMVIVTPAQAIGAVNHAAARLFDRAADEMIGAEFGTIAAREPWTTAQALLGEVLARGTSRDLQVADAASGRSWELTLEALGESRGVIVIARDVEAKAHLRAGPNRVDMLAEVGRLVGGVAHEVRNPLFGIGATLDALEARFGARDELESYMRVLRGELGRLGRLVNDLVAYGKPHRLSRSSHRADDILDEAVALTRGQLDPPAVTIARGPAAPSPMVSVDRGRFVHALHQLVENAVHRSPVGGSVRLSARAHERSLIVEVADEGPAIPEGELPRLFLPFVSHRAGGTGLGLSIVHRIIEQHDGRISAHNLPDGGLMVTIQLPSEGADGG
jgi:PAS domain S-box-containing protein